MKPTLTIVIVCAGIFLSLQTGCKQADHAVKVHPSHAELFTLEAAEPSLPINVGVEGEQEVRPIILVAQPKKIEPTPEQRAILGIKEPPEIDRLLLYRPPRGPEHGVSAEDFALKSGIGDGWGGARVMLDRVYPSYAVNGLAGGSYGISNIPRYGAQVGIARDRVGNVGNSWRILIGEGRAREPARAQTRYYR